MKPKQILAMNQLIAEIVQKINPEYDVIYDDEFYCDLDKRIIAYTDQDNAIIQQIFCDYIYQTYRNIPKISYFTLSILHELGHAETEDDIVDDSRARFAFNRKIGQSDEEFYARCTQYYQLPNEQLANDWAVQFLQTNIKECVEWDNKIEELLGAI